MTTVEFYFDYSSPWTFYAFDRVEDFCARNDAELIWKPFLVGGVFNKVNPSVYARRENPVPPKDAYYQKDMVDWGLFQGIKMIKPSIFPLNSVKALRGAFVAIEEGTISAYSRACFEAYWCHDKDLSQEGVLREIVSSVGMDADNFMAQIGDDRIKKKLFETTDEIIARGGFGSPTFFLNKTDMYFGNDRLELMQAAIERGKAA
ncbi:MAG: 2-hydroxychromene-2-carboxylate isomerase [Alphaproteobacteria bacterium]|nr:2-hydroxychromene-2-carboxylate isomerase [Alphaproteobacteria bacterium]